MTINFDKALLNVAGDVYGPKAWEAVVQALMSTKPGAAPADKQRSYELAIKIRSNPGSVEMTVDDAQFVKDWCGWLLDPLNVGQVNACIEGGE